MTDVAAGDRLIGDYSDAYQHDQTVEVRADQLTPGDRVMIGAPRTWDEMMFQGPVYEVGMAYKRTDGWVVRGFGADMVTWLVEAGETFRKVVTPHDPPTCGYCVYRTEKALSEIEERKPRPFNALIAEYLARRS